jgi:opacity protein-like surface antigen
MRKRIWWRPLLALAFAAGLGLPISASAQDDEGDDDPDAGIYQQNGFYLGAMGVFGPWTESSSLERNADRRIDPIVAPRTNSSDLDNAWGMNARAGYRLHPRFALEGQWEWLTDTDRENTLSDGTRVDDKISLFTLTGNAKYYLLTERIQPYAIAGAGWSRSRIKQSFDSTRRNNGFTARFGGGVDLYGSPDVALSLEAAYVLNTGGLDDLSYVSLGAGLTLRFYPLD